MTTDFAGRIIDPGDTVAYPVRRGSDMYLRTLRVSAVVDEIVCGSNDKGNLVRLLHSDRCVIITKGESSGK